MALKKCGNSYITIKQDSNAIGVSLNDDLGVPRRSPAGRGSTCEGGPINVVHVIFIICFVPILTYGHESWVMTERMRSQVQASEMRFLRRIEGVTLFNKVRSSEIRKSLNIEPLLLRIERSQLRWFGHVSRMPQERLPKQALHAKANGRRPVGRPRTRWTDYIEDLGWNRLGLRPSEMMEVMEDREVWRLNLELLPPQPSRKSGQ